MYMYLVDEQARLKFVPHSNPALYCIYSSWRAHALQRDQRRPATDSAQELQFSRYIEASIVVVAARQHERSARLLCGRRVRAQDAR